VQHRLALSARLLLLMTWLDDYGPEPVAKLDISLSGVTTAS